MTQQIKVSEVNPSPQHLSEARQRDINAKVSQEDKERDLRRIQNRNLRELQERRELGILERDEYIKLELIAKAPRKRVRDSVVTSDRRYKAYYSTSAYSENDYQGSSIRMVFGTAKHPMNTMFSTHSEMVDKGYKVNASPFASMDESGHHTLVVLFAKPLTIQQENLELLFKEVQGFLEVEYKELNQEIDNAQRKLDLHWIGLAEWEAVTKPDAETLAQKAKEARERLAK